VSVHASTAAIIRATAFAVGRLYAVGMKLGIANLTLYRSRLLWKFHDFILSLYSKVITVSAVCIGADKSKLQLDTSFLTIAQYAGA
jgi:hypothetical protein